MRIVGGTLRGRTLNTFKGQDIRPTADKVRESLFNILQFDIASKSFLDLFCGTGAVGIEAYSRGANVVLNDFNRQSIMLAKSNLNSLNIADKITVNFGDAIAYLSIVNKKFDYIFIDPPYKSDLGLKALNNCHNALSQDGTVIFEDEKEFTAKIDGLKVVDKRKYGRVHLTFLKKE